MASLIRSVVAKALALTLLALVLAFGLLPGCTPSGSPASPTAAPGVTSVPSETQLPGPTAARTPAPTPAPPPQGTLNLVGDDPLTLDPALSGDASSHDYIVQVFSGLVRLGDDLQPVADIARRWEISPDGRTYTFDLRDDVRFQDGRQVKAEDFKFSWERAASPATGSTTVLTYLGDIVGVKEMLSGNATSISGVKALGDYVLEVTIDSPKSYFLSKMTYTTAFVVDRNNVRSGSNWWTKPNGTGPFKLRQWNKGQQIILDRNDLYYGDKARVKSVVFSILSGLPMNLYETGQVDVVGVSLPYIERASDHSGPFAGQLMQSPLLSFAYLGFNSQEPPFGDPNIRMAFSSAVDKDKLVTVSFKDMALRADGILPPGMPGYNTNISGTAFDVQKARDLIANSSYGSVDNLPPITLTTAGEGGAVSGYLEAIVYQWKQNLGVDVTIRTLEPERYFYNLKAELDQIFDLNWIADYPHPQDFLDILFHSGSDNNYGGYNDPDYDALVDQANRMQDFSAAAPLYQQAEQKLVDEAGALPLFFWQNYTLVRPYVKGYEPNPLGFLMLNRVSVQAH